MKKKVTFSFFSLSAVLLLAVLSFAPKPETVEVKTDFPSEAVEATFSLDQTQISNSCCPRGPGWKKEFIFIFGETNYDRNGDSFVCRLYEDLGQGHIAPRITIDNNVRCDFRPRGGQ